MKRLIVPSVLLLLGVAGQVHAQVFALPTPNDFRNASWAFGELFTVGSQDITVTALGAYDAGLNGFVTSGGIPVGIFRESDGALLASTNVLSGDTLIDNFRYAAITPLTLTSGVQYRVVAVNENDLYNIDGNHTVDPLITRDRYGYGQSTTLARLDTFTGTDIIWMANFQAQVARPTDVPEPGSVAMLVGMGLSGVGLLARRRRK